MSATKHIETLVKERVEQCYVIATDYFNRTFIRPSVTFNQRGKIAASARLQTNELRFNRILLQDNFEAFTKEVIPHEVCHLLTYVKFGRVKPHGKEWQFMMINVFNLTPHIYHKMDVSKVAGKTFLYQCNCGEVELSLRRHNKIIRGQQSYFCRRCSATLQKVSY